jgi:predicted DNA-binding transcriptional regulator AlpA
MKNTEVQTTLPEVGFVRLPKVLAVYPVGRSTWFEGVRVGRFPKPVKLGPRTSAWRVQDIRELIERCSEGVA